MRAAVGFLTVLPIGGAHSGPRRATLLAFPLVGIGIGCVWAGLGWAASQAWDPFVAAALVVAADLALTGALHADAVADVADGVASRKPPAEAMAIMREPQVGAVGAVTATIVVLLRLAFVTSLVAAGLWSLLALVPVCGRAAMVAVLAPGDSSQPSLAAEVVTLAIVALTPVLTG
jgi:adenosylcobinamide-GDP ribazoletransferase